MVFIDCCRRRRWKRIWKGWDENRMSWKWSLVLQNPGKIQVSQTKHGQTTGKSYQPRAKYRLVRQNTDKIQVSQTKHRQNAFGIVPNSFSLASNYPSKWTVPLNCLFLFTMSLQKWVAHIWIILGNEFIKINNFQVRKTMLSSTFLIRLRWYHCKSCVAIFTWRVT